MTSNLSLLLLYVFVAWAGTTLLSVRVRVCVCVCVCARARACVRVFYFILFYFINNMLHYNVILHVPVLHLILSYTFLFGICVALKQRIYISLLF
jgi:hypothetical protein